MALKVFDRIPYRRAAAVAAAGLVLYLLLGFLLAPWVIQRSITGFAADTLQRKVSIGTVRFNPLLLKLEIGDFALAERDGAPIGGFRRLLVNFELSSLVRWAWTFSEITLEGLDLKADIAPGGRFNLVALLDDLPRQAPRPDSRPPRLLLQRVVLSGGAIAFSDRSDPTPASTRLGPINFELHDISTLPDRSGTYSVSARLAEGGDISWRGEISLQPLSSQGDISVKGAKPQTAWRFLRDELGLAEPRGELDFVSRYRVAYAGGVPQATLEDLRLAGRGIALTAIDTKMPVLELASLEVRGGRFDLAARELVIPGIVLRDGTVVVDVDAGGRVNWRKLIRTDAGKKPATREAPATGKPWKARVESLQVEKVGLDYTDSSRAKPIRLAAKEVTAGLAATIETRPVGIQVLLEKVALKLDRLSAGAPAPAEPLAVLDTVTIEGGTLSLEESRLDVGRAAVSGGSISVTREKNGAIPLADLLSTTDAGLLRREVASAVEQAKVEGRPWRMAVDALEVSGTSVALSDHSFGAPVQYDLQDLRARVDGFRSDGKEPIRFDFSTRLAQGGGLSANGSFRLSGDQAEARAKLDRINLKPLQPALASRARVVLASGEFSGNVKAQYRLRKARHVVRASGPLGINNLLLNEAGGGERLLAWKSLSTDSVRLSLDPDELRIGEVRVVGLGAKVVVFKDRSVNLVEAVKVQADAGAATAPAATPGAPATVGDTEPLFLVHIGRVDVESGAVEFADLSLALPFAANVQDLGGVVQGVSTDRESRASVRLEGRVDEHGLARVEGSLRPFRPKSFLDLGVSFRNVEMPPLSPYTVTFAGRRIASGRLALDLRYKIDNSMLSGDNRILLEKFTLGERVETPGALSLPLDLAVALLTDSQGRIDLAVPVSGNVDDPQFSYGHLIGQAIRNVLTRIVTAPFRALGSLFGGSGGGENLESIAFDPGRAALLPPEREKLKRVTAAIGKRPQLRLVAEGQYGASDQAALRQRDVESAVSARLRRPTAADATTEPVNVTDARIQRALEALFIERNSEQALDELAGAIEKSRGKPVERVSAVLALAGRASSDRAFYEALLKRLIDTAPLPDEALRQLADARARSVTGYLVKDLSVPAERVTARIAATPDEARVKLAFDVASVGGGASAPRD
jgi:hypothetical protein